MWVGDTEMGRQRRRRCKQEPLITPLVSYVTFTSDHLSLSLFCDIDRATYLLCDILCHTIHLFLFFDIDRTNNLLYDIYMTPFISSLTLISHHFPLSSLRGEQQ